MRDSGVKHQIVPSLQSEVTTLRRTSVVEGAGATTRLATLRSAAKQFCSTWHDTSQGTNL